GGPIRAYSKITSGNFYERECNVRSRDSAVLASALKPQRGGISDWRSIRSHWEPHGISRNNYALCRCGRDGKGDEPSSAASRVKRDISAPRDSSLYPSRACVNQMADRLSDAYRRGQHACRQGIRSSENPYGCSDERALAWDIGWQDAQALDELSQY